MPRIHSISVVIPVFNAQHTLGDLVSELHSVLRENADRFEILLVNDGSSDSSWDQIGQLSRKHQSIRGINLGRNYGQHNALLAGIRSAKFDLTLTMDDDGQNPPTEIPKLLCALSEQIDAVYGKAVVEQHGIWRVLSSKLTKLALRYFMGTRIATSVSPFRLFRTKLRESFRNFQSDYVSIDILLSWTTDRFETVAVEHRKRTAGQTNYSFFKLVRHACNLIIGYSTVPLRIASAIGLVFTFLGGLILVYVLVRYFVVGTVVPGFAFTACIISLFSGAQLFSIGVLGEYIARVYGHVLERPAYTVREETQNSNGSTIIFSVEASA